jgi:hypothetical protein
MAIASRMSKADPFRYLSEFFLLLGGVLVFISLR